MKHEEIRRAFREFFESKGHLWVPSSSLLPTDPSVLFTTAGMQQFKPYYLNPELAPAQSVASIQKCLRTSDIDEVGDESHLTFFEMLGNFSFGLPGQGGYGKKEAIQYAHEFITQKMGLAIDHVSVFAGEDNISADTESEEIWKSVDPNIKIERSGRADNFWGPTGDKGPCGPTTEIYVNSLEVWNIVFNQYYQSRNGELGPLKTLGVDTGMGLERLAMVSQDVPTIYETDLFAPLMELIPEGDMRIKRIVADHCRAIVFLLADGVIPSNKEQGYVLRRLMRRVIVYERMHELSADAVLTKFIEQYGELYPALATPILDIWRDEKEKFGKTLEKGLREFEKLIPIGEVQRIQSGKEPKAYNRVDAAKVFDLYQTYGFPIELTKELLAQKALLVDEEELDKELSMKLKEHQEQSRTASAGMFKGGLADQSEQVVKYHTATHLLNAALRRVLGEHVMQRGSNINAERLRFDFSHAEKLTTEEKMEIERLVNEWIQRDLPVTREEMPQEEAQKLGAIGAFGEKYGDIVSVYTIQDPNTSEIISREFCGGPHVEHTGTIGHFSIIKEESASAGVRRIKAVIS